MDSELIPAKLIELSAAITDKTGDFIDSPTMFVSPRDSGAFWSVLYIKGKEHKIRSDTAAGFFSSSFSLLSSLPSEAEQNLAEFQGKLAGLIDMGRDYNIPLDFLNPLIATSKNLAENAIEDKS